MNYKIQFLGDYGIVFMSDQDWQIGGAKYERELNLQTAKPPCHNYGWLWELLQTDFTYMKSKSVNNNILYPCQPILEATKGDKETSKHL